MEQLLEIALILYFTLAAIFYVNLLYVFSNDESFELNRTVMHFLIFFAALFMIIIVPLYNIRKDRENG